MPCRCDACFRARAATRRRYAVAIVFRLITPAARCHASSLRYVAALRLRRHYAIFVYVDVAATMIR